MLYGRTIKEWAELAGISKQAMSTKIARGYDPRELVNNQTLAADITAKVSISGERDEKVLREGNVGRPRKASNRIRVQVILDEQAMSILEDLKEKTGIQDRSKLIKQLIKVAGNKL